ncbi:probable transporter MCH4 [Lingula anatina]|uniref:Probable transporter MCH4 n=1 Tax=Lingula anatina TaxID=7574 RepID=A0A1S3J290_LINAN|nr:probable transporter MCH4 [Lingula anatina]|eukprot:XP_013404532.1 probable transporter MCH4 [Lingula anatina]
MYHGWLIVLLTSVLFLAFNGIKMSWGVFVTTFSKDTVLGSSSQATLGGIQSVFFLCCSATSFIGKITSNHSGYKISAFVGTLLVVLGLSLSAIAPSATYLIFSNGVLYGLGMNILVSPLFFIVADWFPWEHRYHVMCTSWAMVTMPLGTVVFGNLIQWLHESIGWRYGYLVLATFYALWATVSIHTLYKPTKEVLQEAIQPEYLICPKQEVSPSVEIKWSKASGGFRIHVSRWRSLFDCGRRGGIFESSARVCTGGPCERKYSLHLRNLCWFTHD